ncbi:hypothetical protein [Pararhizobium sp. PWRC1-1]|uniref:hypothetical protein n=1 Tax=Pararhizobium sp. PWRC1-1 TaxID=2804566 RepID=UPI003CED261B
MRHQLKAREYKLLLNPGVFEARPSLTSANDFWTRRVSKIVEHLDNVRPFQQVVHRVTRFWDDANCILSKNDLILRTREETNAGFISNGQSGVTLKLRMPDQFVVASTTLTEDGDIKTEFEEDIGPLEIRASLNSLEPRVVLPRKLSSRNRFSLSSTITTRTEELPFDLEGVFRIFPGVPDILRASYPERLSRLQTGHTVYEYAFKEGSAKFDADIVGEFTLSLWCFTDPTAKPSVAELSYKCRTSNGVMTGKAARKAFKLFLALQESLSDIVDPDNTSKTALALPQGCQNA